MACPWCWGISNVPTTTTAALCFLWFLSLHIPCYHWDKWIPDSGNQLQLRLFCLPTGDRGPEQTSPINRVPYQAAGRTVFMFADSTLQQLSLWPRSSALINVSLKARQTNVQGSMIPLVTFSRSNSPYLFEVIQMGTSGIMQQWW